MTTHASGAVSNKRINPKARLVVFPLLGESAVMGPAMEAFLIALLRPPLNKHRI